MTAHYIYPKHPGGQKLHEIWSVYYQQIIKIVATSCQILRQKCPAGGAYSAPPDPLAGFKGPTSNGRGWEGRGGEGRRGRRGGGKEKRGGEGGGRGRPLLQIPGSAPDDVT